MINDLTMGGSSNLKNALIAFLVPLPSVLFYLSFLNNYESAIQNRNDDSNDEPYFRLWTWCYQHPLLLANLLFFLNVNVLFWIIGLIQSCHWVSNQYCLLHLVEISIRSLIFMEFDFVVVQMIDPYWTAIPLMLLHYYATHPLAQYDLWRSRIVIFLTWVWSIRLSHNYFRREKWQWGAREDWRFSDLSQQYGKHWWWASFFAVYVSQQVSIS